MRFFLILTDAYGKKIVTGIVTVVTRIVTGAVQASDRSVFAPVSERVRYQTEGLSERVMPLKALLKF